VIGYDSVKQRVKLSDGWGYIKTFPVSEVWLPPAKADTRTGGRPVFSLVAVGAAAGAFISAIITALLMR